MTDHEPNATAIVEFDPIKRTLQEFRTKYGGRTFDVSTPEGFAETKAVAKDGKKALILLEKIRKARKERALRICQQVDAEGRELKDGIGAIFDPIFRQVDAEQQRQDNARAEAERIERQRVAAIQMAIADLSRPVAFGATTAEIAERLAFVESVAIGAAFGEFEDDAFFAKAGAVRALREILEKSQAADAEREAAAERDAELARQRRENERLRREAEERERADRESLRLAEVDRTISATVSVTFPEEAPEDVNNLRTVIDGWPQPVMTQELIDDMNVGCGAMIPPLFPVEQSMVPDGMRSAAFCRSCLRVLPPAATDCECGWTMPWPSDGDGAFPEMAGTVADPLAIEYDRVNDVLTVCGARYSGALFRELGMAPTGRWLQIVDREDGVISCRTVSDDLAREFDNLIVRDEAFRGLRRAGKGL